GFSASWAHAAFGMTSTTVFIGSVFTYSAPLAVGSLNFTSGPFTDSDLQCIVPDPDDKGAVYICNDKGVFHYSPTTGVSSKNKTLGVTQISTMDVHPRHGGLIGFGAQDLGDVVSFFGNGNDVAALRKGKSWALINGCDGGGAAFRGDASSRVYVANTCGE